MNDYPDMTKEKAISELSRAMISPKLKSRMSIESVLLLLSDNKRQMVAARRNGNDALAAELSQQKEVLKGKLRHHCLDCKTPIDRNAQRCHIHARAHRFKTNRKLTFAAMVSICVFLWVGCSTPTKPIAVAPVVTKPIKAPLVTSALMPLAIVTPCPTLVRTNGFIYIYTNCVLKWVMQLNTNWTNPNYGQFAFTGYVTTNNAISVETGTAQPADWIGPMWSPIKVWTLQYKYNYRDAWSDGISDTNSQTYVQFSEADATQPSVFYRVKYQ